MANNYWEKLVAEFLKSDPQLSDMNSKKINALILAETERRPSEEIMQQFKKPEMKSGRPKNSDVSTPWGSQ